MAKMTSVVVDRARCRIAFSLALNRAAPCARPRRLITSAEMTQRAEMRQYRAPGA
jgi:hypothetical protein